MKIKNISCLLAAALLNLLAFSLNGQSARWCATDSINNAALTKSASARQSQQQFKNFVDQYIKNNPPN
jgi:hypothetical protein